MFKIKFKMPNLGKMLGVTKLEKEIRTLTKELGVHDDIVTLFRNSGEIAVRATLSSLPQDNVDQIVQKLHGLTK